MPVREPHKSSPLLPVLTASVLFFILLGYKAEGGFITDNSHAPSAAADYLDTYDGDIILYAGFNNGAYMRFRGYDTYMDARPELYTKKMNGKEDRLSEFIAISGDADHDFASFIGRYGFTHMLVEDKSMLRYYLTAQGYTICARGPGYMLFGLDEVVPGF